MTRICLCKGLVPQYFEFSPQHLRGSEKPKMRNTNGALYLFYLQTAAEYVKSRLPEVLKQHLQDYEKDKENSVLSYQTILEQQILSIDREMLEKLTVSYDEAGMLVFNTHTRFLPKEISFQPLVKLRPFSLVEDEGQTGFKVI